jgi:TolB protein
MLMILIAAALISRELTAQDDDTPPQQVNVFQVPTASDTPIPTLTHTPRPTRTISPDTIIVTELPGEWTPNPEVSSTPSPEPTTRPDTRNSLEIIFSGANQASAAAELLTVRADGDLLPRRLPIDLSNISDDIYEEREFLDPAYSPDGRMLAFTAQVAPDVQEIFILALDNGALRQLTDLGASVTDGATWSADGRRLVFSSNAPSTDRATIFDLFEIDVDSGESEPLTDGTARNREPVWSPDGSVLAFSSDKGSPGEREIWLIDMNAGSRTPEKLTDAANSSFAPSFSPDGAQIAFISNRGGDNDLFVMNANGTSERLVSSNDNEIDDRDPAWSPDGNWILLSSNRSGGASLQLWLVRPDGSDWTPVTEGDGDNRAGNWLPIN